VPNQNKIKISGHFGPFGGSNGVKENIRRYRENPDTQVQVVGQKSLKLSEKSQKVSTMAAPSAQPITETLLSN